MVGSSAVLYTSILFSFRWCGESLRTWTLPNAVLNSIDENPSVAPFGADTSMFPGSSSLSRSNTSMVPPVPVILVPTARRMLPPPAGKNLADGTPSIAVTVYVPAGSPFTCSIFRTGSGAAVMVTSELKLMELLSDCEPGEATSTSAPRISWNVSMMSSQTSSASQNAPQAHTTSPITLQVVPTTLLMMFTTVWASVSGVLT